mmetsp:Transcript_12519/g.29394  ORF Transcript_12519/g.29394 Transcript_12519/m.29394 type:complete len:144 (-) Transcript_12519:67-498(-)
MQPQQRRRAAVRVAACGLVGLLLTLAAPCLQGSAFVGNSPVPRRLIAWLPLLTPACAGARPPPKDGFLPGGKAPSEIASEEEAESWEAIDVGESTLIDKDDPKYKKMSVLMDIERQQKRNEQYGAMSGQEKAEKMCELLGRGC